MEENIFREANYIIENNKTIREAARDLGISKSALHRHMSKDLVNIDYDLYLKVKSVFLEHNKNRPVYYKHLTLPTILR
ncbi:MAG: sporulation transcriptional regulator SpoIIID, partial [Bacilli bacterium]|nr:sporulation transcriptional regulator SpoIIID [Bacilli bacterium]